MVLPRAKMRNPSPAAAARAIKARSTPISGYPGDLAPGLVSTQATGFDLDQYAL